MGNGVGVALPPGARNVSYTALVHAKHAAILAHIRTAQIIQIAARYYAVVDERVISRVQRTVEREVVYRINRLMQEVEVRSKILFVKTISTTTVAQAYNIQISDVRHIQISKRQYQVYNCGPELPDVPALDKVSRFLELRDIQVIDFLLGKCVWAVWRPSASWFMKVDQVYDLTIHLAVRHEGFITGEVRIIKLRVGRKWVGPHHHDTMNHGDKTKWLHRTDYEVQERELTAESVFYQTISAAWQDFLGELSRLPKEDSSAPDDNGQDFLYDAQEKRTSLRVKYLVETSLERIVNARSTMFRSIDKYELWRMEQEDKPIHQTSAENVLAGPLLDAHIDMLAEYYEVKAMATEDVQIWV